MKKKPCIFLFPIFLIICILSAGCSKTDESTSLVMPQGLDGEIVLSYSGWDSYAIQILSKNGEEIIRSAEYNCITCNLKVRPSWVPDGSGVLFSVSDAGGLGWYRINRDGTGLTSLLSVSPNLSLSPDGTHYVYCDIGSVDSLNISIMNSDLSDVEHIAKGADPSWSPDGTKIYFTSHSGVSPSLYYILLADRTVNKVGDIPENSLFWAWSPTKTKVLYSFLGAAYSTMNLDGSDPQTVGTLNSNDPCEFLCWSPDGTKLAFRSSRGFFAVDLDGTNIIDILSNSYPTAADWR